LAGIKYLDLTVEDGKVVLVKVDMGKPMLRPDGSTLPVQEFLDRQSEWRLVILYKEGENPSGFVALSIEVNGWIVWRNDIEV